MTKQEFTTADTYIDAHQSVIEYGIRFPDGKESFDIHDLASYISNPRDLASEKGQGSAQDKYRWLLAQYGVPVTDDLRLTFISRQRVVSFSNKPTELKAAV